MSENIVMGVDLDALITAAVLDEYWECGYWISPKLFDDEQIARLRQAHERMWSGDFDYEIPSQYGIRKADPASPAVRQQCNAFWLLDEVRQTWMSDYDIRA